MSEPVMMTMCECGGAIRWTFNTDGREGICAVCKTKQSKTGRREKWQPGIDYCDRYWFDTNQDFPYLCTLPPGHDGMHESSGSPGERDAMPFISWRAIP